MPEAGKPSENTLTLTQFCQGLDMLPGGYALLTQNGTIIFLSSQWKYLCKEDDQGLPCFELNTNFAACFFAVFEGTDTIQDQITILQEQIEAVCTGEQDRLIQKGHRTKAFSAVQDDTTPKPPCPNHLWVSFTITRCILDHTPYALVHQQDHCELVDRVQERTLDLEREVSHHKQTAEKLWLSEYRLRYLLSTSPVVIFSSKASGDFGATFVSENITSIFGYDPEEFINDSAFWADHLHPNDAAQVFAGLDQLFITGTHEHVYRFLHKDGTYRWTENKLHLIRDEQGTPQEIIGSLQDVSDRKELERQLVLQERRLKGFFLNATAGLILLDKDMRYIQVNEIAARMNGIPLQNHIGRTVAEVLPELFPNIKPVFDRVLIEGEVIKHVAVSGFTPADPSVLRFWEGSYFPVLNGRGQIDGMGGIFVEVTERKQAEEALRRSEELYRLLSESSPNLTCLHDPDGTYLYVSSASKPLLGFAPDELIGTNPYRLIHPLDAEHIRKEHSTLLSSGDKHVVEYRLRQKYGGYIWLETHSQCLLDDDGQVIRIQSVSSDITTRKQTQQDVQSAYDELEQRVLERTKELQEANELLQLEIAERTLAERELADERSSLERRVYEQTKDLKFTNAKLAQASRLKDEFLANMSHELRTPLNAILGLSEALQEEVYGPLTSRQARSLRSIEESGRHLLDLINDILDLSKIEAGKTQIEFTQVAIESLCQASLRLVRSQAQKKRLSVVENIDSQVQYIWADERRIKQILVNLLTNAVKFTLAHGQVGLDVIGNTQDQQVTFRVWDTGIGIAPEDITRLFKPFEQLDSGLARHHEGTGLGLVLVSRLVDMHGGSISVESKKDRGSKFTIVLPWHEQCHPSNQRAVEEHVPSIPADISKDAYLACPRIPTTTVQQALIIEDSPSAADQVARYLHELGIKTVTYPQGYSAVKHAHEIKPDLIILDLMLPGVSGWDILQQFRQDPVIQHIPIIITSVLNEKARGAELGANAYLVKPVIRQQLYHIVAAIFPQVSPLLQQLSQKEQEHNLDFHRSRPLILLAEDNEENIAMIAEYLEVRGYRVEVARNGSDAITSIRQFQPALVLMDIQMPGMDGLEATRRIRADETIAHIPIIALTALAMEGDRERCLAAGVNEYMSKPVRLKALLELLKQYLP
jgi:PAS domain S-box-containing protein